MIDFNTASFIKLNKVNPQDVMHLVEPLLVSGEEIFLTTKGIRDSVVFTNKRLLVINVKGITGKKVDTTSLPYSKIQSFSVETAGTFDRDSELDLWFSGLGVVRLEFGHTVDIRSISQFIAGKVL